MTFRIFILPALLLSSLLSSGFSPSSLAASASGYLRWHPQQRRVDADVRNWPLQKALERIAAHTGWQVFVEPGLQTRVSAEFRNRPEREALATLLADINYALLPSTNGSSRLLVFRSNTSRATVAVEPALPEAEAGLLTSELVVRLKRDGKTAIDELAKRLGARMAGSLDDLNAHRLVFDDAEAADRARTALDSEPDVESVESNYAVSPPSQVQRLDGAGLPSLGLKARPVSDGSSVIVALIDTAVPSAASPHSDFLLPAVSVGASTPGAVGDGLSHGSAMFETVLQGLALGQQGATGQPVRVLPIDVYGGRSETSTFELAQGIVAALERGADILNLSLAGPNPSPVLHDTIAQASTAGVLTFAAPGNEPTTAPNYPAAYPEVLAVTASTRGGALAPYANRGAFVDLIAPGTSLVPFAGDTWQINGTSVSTAYTAGLAAGLLADSGADASAIAAQLRAKLAFQPPSGTQPAPGPAPSPTP